MADAPLQAQIDAARAYEELMVPALLGEWAPRVAEAAHIQSGDRVLDVACGTGVLARAALPLAGAGDLVAGLDPSAGMLEVARRVTPAVQWRQGVAESLPFPDAAFDVVVSQFGLMFFDDRAEALRQVSRVLRPGGRLAFAVWDSLEAIPAYAIEVALVERLAGPSAAEPLRSPFSLGDRRQLERLFGDAGFDSVEVATGTGTAHFPSVRVMMDADLRGWLPAMGVVLGEERIGSILEAAERQLSEYVMSDGAISFGTSAHLVTATKPSAP